MAAPEYSVAAAGGQAVVGGDTARGFHLDHATKILFASPMTVAPWPWRG